MTSGRPNLADALGRTEAAAFCVTGVAGTVETSVSISITDVGVFCLVVVSLRFCVFFSFLCWCVGGGVYVVLTKRTVVFAFEKE